MVVALLAPSVMTRRYDSRRARAHRNYKRTELAERFGVGLATISAWKRKGLQPIDERRPLLFAGLEVQRFLESHNKPRQPLEPGQIFCVTCKKAIMPKDGIARYVRLSSSLGNLVGTCPACGRGTWRRVRAAEILEKAGSLKVEYEDDTANLSGDGEPPRTEPSDGDLS